MKRLTLATTNPHKIQEIRAALELLEDWPVAVLPASAPAYVETGLTFLENAVGKAVHCTQSVEGLVLADDSGLLVEALGGRPGVLSSRYATTHQERIYKLLHEMMGVPDEQRQAIFVCALALALNGKVIWTVEEEVKGRIAHAPEGDYGFGYDPIFWIPELGCTMAQLPPLKKNAISHRGRAVARLGEFLESLGNWAGEEDNLIH